jgi:hypothetical protein
MKQNYDEYDGIQHIEWLEKAFSDKRYVRVNGKPLFLIYCASDIPDISQKITTWRETIVSKGYPGLYLCSVRSFQNKLSDDEAMDLGFDASVEFQPNPRDFPHKDLLRYRFQKNIRRLMDKFHLHWLYSRITVTNAVNYKALVEKNMGKAASGDVLFPCVMPNWDNSPRRKAAYVIQNEDGNLYRKWLENALSRVQHHPSDEQIVFINAWNEWAEGCHLEPDLRNGRKFLQATKEALDSFHGKG